MPRIAECFYIVLFMSAAGSIPAVLSLFAGRVLRLPLPRWFCVCATAAWFIPVIWPGLRLISPDGETWRDGFYTASSVWVCGTAAFLLYDMGKRLLAGRALRDYRRCEDDRVLTIYERCAVLTGLKACPPVYFAASGEAACVYGILRPRVLLRRDICGQLEDGELTAVLCHELCHIRRGHLLLIRVCAAACILHWFNPFVWIMRRELELCCEEDCDRAALSCLRRTAAAADYARTMLHLLEISVSGGEGPPDALGADGFLTIKRRIGRVMERPSEVRRAAAAVLLCAILSASVVRSLHMSRGYFYPYPAYRGETEYREEI